MMRRITLFLLLVLIAGCAPEPVQTPESPTATVTSVPSPATATLTPSPLPPTATLIPSPTPLPGKLVLPIDTFSNSIPWLPMDETARPSVNYVAFNVLKPPFNSALVRQAFAHAIDRQVIAEMAQKYKTKDPQIATTLTPPLVMGRDLYAEVGAQFDPQKAKELLTEAGYTDPSAFPAVLLIVNSYGDVAPGARFNMANTMADMWLENLGVNVQVQALSRNDFNSRIRTNPPEMYWLGWVADYNDPDNFLSGIFHSGGEYNFGKFSDKEFDQLVERAATLTDPVERQQLYIQAERILCESEVALIPLYHNTFP